MVHPFHNCQICSCIWIPTHETFLLTVNKHNFLNNWFIYLFANAFTVVKFRVYTNKHFSQSSFILNHIYCNRVCIKIRHFEIWNHGNWNTTPVVVAAGVAAVCRALLAGDWRRGEAADWRRVAADWRRVAGDWRRVELLAADWRVLPAAVGVAVDWILKSLKVV